MLLSLTQSLYLRCPPRIHPRASSCIRNDLHAAILYSIVNLFADDTMLFLSNNSLKSLAKKIDIDLKLLVNWLNANLISLNSTKTELLMFQPKRKLTNFDIKIKILGHRIFPSNAVKYLGLLIDNNLSWNHHINHICSKLKRANGALSKLRHFVPGTVLLSLYYALFHSHMSYCCQVWSSIRKLQHPGFSPFKKLHLE